VACIIEIVTVMVCLIARIAIAMAMVFAIPRTAARTTLAATNSKRRHRAMLTLFCRTPFHESAAPGAYVDAALRGTRHERDTGCLVRPEHDRKPVSMRVPPSYN
jgi:hypothetical protein